LLARATLVIAVLAYLTVLGCVLAPGQSLPGGAAGGGAVSSSVGGAGAASQPLNRVGLPYRAAGMQIQRVDWMDQYKRSVDEIAAVGCDTVKFVVDARQENGTSNRIYLDLRMTPTPEALSDLIRYAKGKGLRVILMPIVLLDAPRGNEWRGTLKPESWSEWFESYREILTHFAWIAQGSGVDVFVVGSELVSSETRTDEWKRTIAKVRETFKGYLTYSSNWDHYTAVSFWDQLDLIGMNSYWKLGADSSVSVEEIGKRWKEIQAGLLPFVEKTGKPLLFLEVGWCSMSNAAHEPWDYTTGDPIDLELQARLYEGFFRTWHGNPLLGGFSIWEWTPGDGGPDDRGYTPENKPAEQVLREWLAKPAWTVK
jgi:hypothetical protein